MSVLASDLLRRLRILKSEVLKLDGFTKVAVVCSILSSLWILRKGLFLLRQDSISTMTKDSAKSNSVPRQANAAVEPTDALITDPGLLKKHSEIRSFTVPRRGFTYNEVRIFYRPHTQADKLPTQPRPLPLFVFLHGLGGSASQFHPLLSSLVHLAPCLAVDLPGCGRSSFDVRDWEAYKTEALTDLLEVIIEDYRSRVEGQQIVFIAHSMGCSLAALLSTGSLKGHAVGLIAICPKASPPSQSEVALFRKLLYIPGAIFNLWRQWDRRGGAESISVSRFVGQDADIETKKLQYKFNEQSKTPVWRRMAWGALPSYDSNGLAHGGIPGKEIWSKLEVPILLVSGELDHITKPEEALKIGGFLGYTRQDRPRSDEITNNGSAVISKSVEHVKMVDSASAILGKGTNVEAVSLQAETTGAGPSTNQLDQDQPSKLQRILKVIVLPAPASHSLMYMTATSRTLAGIVSDFLAAHVSPRLSLGWQLQHLTTEGKWDVKNLAKWSAVLPVSQPIGNTFRAIKTLREVDEVHSPAKFVAEWGNRISDVIDISHDNPVYDPRGLEHGGVHYHKFATVSKIPPTVQEVKDFIILVDKILKEQNQGDSLNETNSINKKEQMRNKLIGVHCHYGYNRTGFFIVSYLVERKGYRLQDAIEEFAQQRGPGIRHDHFIDTLFVRYCVGLKRAPTISL